MNRHLGVKVPSASAQAEDSLRRIREPIAWTLLVLTAIIVIVSAFQLFHLAGATIPVVAPQTTQGPAVPVGTAPPAAPAALVSTFALRASAVAPQFDATYVIALPVLSVLLVLFTGSVTKHARQVIFAAAVVQAATLVLGVISMAGAAASHTRPGTWFILEAPLLAIAATALIFTGAVIRSRDLGPTAPRVQRR